ncbi:MAG: (2Fe-2S)-binding protein [candidate division Zixibacteria bacterium]|nr:(2Fe-2S)-binding protein [candidate division Zixibacteria bacterium]
MVHITINGKVVKAAEGEMLLTVLKREGIDIPALCHHEAIEPTGNCRLCMVEISRAEWEGWKKHVTSCLYPVEDGLIVNTHTPEVIEIRKTIIDLQLANCPDSDVIQKMAEEYGIYKTSYETVPEGDNCIMCYACTRICEVLGKSAISAVMRGHKKVIAPPFGEEPPDCIGCLACAQICPTNVIPWTDTDSTRTIWKKTFDLITCTSCGKAVITKDFAEYLMAQRQIPKEYFETCDECKRMATARKMGEIVTKAQEAAL